MLWDWADSRLTGGAYSTAGCGEDDVAKLWRELAPAVRPPLHSPEQRH